MQVALYILLFDEKIISISLKKPTFTENPVSASIGHIEGNDISTSASENNVATLQKRLISEREIAPGRQKTGRGSLAPFHVDFS